MKKTFKRIAALVLAILTVTAVFAGCSNAKKTDVDYIIATDTTFKPFEYTDANGDFVGIDVDILAAIAEDQGFTYELKSLGWDASIAAC